MEKEESERKGEPTGRRVPTRLLAGVTILFLLGLAGALFLFTGRQPSEPSFQGKSLSQWLADLDYSHRPRDIIASNAVHQMGTNILPYLKPMLCAYDSPLKVKLVDLLSKQSLVKIKFTRADERRESASRACHVLGPAAVQYLPELTAMLDSKRSMTAWCGLVGLLDVRARMACVAEMAKALTNDSAQVRSFSAMILGQQGVQAEPAIQALINCLKDPDNEVRQAAARAW